MNTFIFQSVPEKYDLRKALRPGKSDTWYATRYKNDMHPGDLVFFWMGGDEDIRGLYGWGKICSESYLEKGWDSHGVDANYEVKFKTPISAKLVRKHPLLKNMLIFRAPQATNFLLSFDEAKNLAKLVESQGEKAPSIIGGER